MRRGFQHTPHMLRLAGFVATGMLVTSVVSLRAARAHMNDGMQRLARQLMPYAEQGVMEAPRRVVINGESVFLALGTTQDSVETAMDYYAARCAETSGHLAEQLRDVTPPAEAATASGATGAAPMDHAAFNRLWQAIPGRHAQGLEVFRSGDENGGYVACIDVGSRHLTGGELQRRLQALVATGDLSQYGNFRYAYVSHTSTGNTRILTVATEGRFNLLRMFPSTGDAPGEDITGLARYPQMRRVVSAFEENHPNKLGIYTVRAPLGDVRSFYLRQMPQRGWTVMDVPRDRPLPPELEARRQRLAAFAHGDDTLMLVFDESEGTTSMMSLLGR